MATTKIELCERQLDALEHSASELLVGSDDDQVGRSYLLRAAAILLCAQHERLSAVLTKKTEFELNDVHVYGPNGIVNMVGVLRQDKVVTIGAKHLRFNSNGSTIRWLPCGDERQMQDILARNPGLLLVDDLEEIPEMFYERMVSHVLSSPSNETLRRVIATTRAASNGWISRRWSGGTGGRDFLRMVAGDLDADLRRVYKKSSVLSFKIFCELAMPTMHWVAAREAIAKACEDLVNGVLVDGAGDRIDRLMVRAPAQIGKSTFAQLLAAWWLFMNPEKTAACATYNQEKANEFGYHVREYYLAAGGRIRSDSKAVSRWHTEEGGGFWVRSVDSGAAGNPANLLIEDDLDKDLAHALQPKHRTMVRDIWYGPVWLNRWNAEHGRLIEVNIGTPHDIDDSQSFILESSGAGEDGASRNWHVVALQAIYDRENYPIRLPDGAVLADDWRSPGEPLAPSLAKFTTLSIQRYSETMQPASFAAMFQCTPVHGQGGGVINPAWLMLRDEDPGLLLGDYAAYIRVVRAWDLAHTEGGGDWTAGVKIGLVKATNRILVRHAVRAQKAAGGVKRLIATMMLVDGQHVVIRLPDDPSAGRSWLSDVVEYLRDICRWLQLATPTIIGVRPQGDKRSRSDRIVNRAEPPLRDIEVSETNCNSLDVYGGDWTPSLPDVVPGFARVVEDSQKLARGGDQDAARRVRELRSIAEMARAIFVDEVLARRLNISPSGWLDELLYELKMFDGIAGHVDDQVDALGDALDEIVKRALGGHSNRIPGW